MSKEEADDERRLHQCARKYEEIVKQFDELIDMMNNRTRPPAKRRRLSSTIAKFLNNLQPETDADCSKRTNNPE